MSHITDKANAGSVSTTHSFRTHPHRTHPESPLVSRWKARCMPFPTAQKRSRDYSSGSPRQL
jgi:hypothetical protein